MSNLLHPGLMLLAGSLLLLVLPDKWIKAVMPAAALCAFVAVFTLREGSGMFLQLLPQLRMQFLAVDRLSWAFTPGETRRWGTATGSRPPTPPGSGRCRGRHKPHRS